MNWKLPHPLGSANDNAGKQCPHCGRRHDGASPAELDRLSEFVRDNERDDFLEQYRFVAWPLDRLPPNMRGVPGCPVAFSPEELARLARAKRENELTVLQLRHPECAPAVNGALLRSIDYLAISGLEPLSRDNFTPGDVLTLYTAADFAAKVLEQQRAFDVVSLRADARVARALAPLRRTARARALPADDRHAFSDEWITSAFAESERFQAWIEKSLPRFREVVSAREPSARAIAAAITGQRDDGDRSLEYAAFPVFRTVRAEVEKHGASPKARLTARELASEIERQVERDDANGARAVDSAMNW